MKRMIAVGTLLAVCIAMQPVGSSATSAAQEPQLRVWLPALLADASLPTLAPASGRLVIGQSQEPDTLYIHSGGMLATKHILNSLYDGPIDVLTYEHHPVIIDKLPRLEDGDGRARLAHVMVQPGQRYVEPEWGEVVVATEPVADLPQLTVQFQLRPGLRWEDGEPLTTADTVFSQRLACDPDTPTSKFLCDRTEFYVARDDRTVEWQGIPGFTDPTYYTNFYTPLPRHQPGSDGRPMSEMSAVEITEDRVFNREPYSYGPFKVAEWVDGEFIRLEKNEHYWRADEGLPYLDEVIHRYMPDSNALLAALSNGDIDVATHDGLDISQFDALSAAEHNGEIVPYYVLDKVWEHIDFNLDPVDDSPALGACKELRKAVALGTDRGTMVDVSLMGKTRVQNTFVPREHWAYPPDDMMIVYEYDPETANQMLEDMGFTDADSNGVREASHTITCTVAVDLDGTTKDKVIAAGTPLELDLITTQGNAMREETTLLFQQDMVAIGVKINLEYLPANVFFAEGPRGPLYGRSFDLAQFAWTTGALPPIGLFFCTEIPSEDTSWGGNNPAGWCNPEFDRLGKLATTALERNDSLSLFHQAQRIFADEIPVLPLFAKVMVMAANPQLVNFRPDATVSSETWNIEEWYLDP